MLGIIDIDHQCFLQGEVVIEENITFWSFPGLQDKLLALLEKYILSLFRLQREHDPGPRRVYEFYLDY